MLCCREGSKKRGGGGEDDPLLPVFFPSHPLHGISRRGRERRWEDRKRGNVLSSSSALFHPKRNRARPLLSLSFSSSPFAVSPFAFVAFSPPLPITSDRTGEGGSEKKPCALRLSFPSSFLLLRCRPEQPLVGQREERGRGEGRRHRGGDEKEISERGAEGKKSRLSLCSVHRPQRKGFRGMRGEEGRKGAILDANSPPSSHTGCPTQAGAAVLAAITSEQGLCVQHVCRLSAPYRNVHRRRFPANTVERERERPYNSTYGRKEKRARISPWREA